MKKTIAKLLCLLMVCLLLLPSCSQNATCTIKEIDGSYYINFADGNEPSKELYMSSISNRISFKSIAEMKQTYSGKEEIEIHKKGGIRLAFPRTEGKGIHFFNIEELLVPDLPNGFTDQPTEIRMEGTPSTIVNGVMIEKDIVYYVVSHTLADNEQVRADSFFYHSKADWALHKEYEITTKLLESIHDDTQKSFDKKNGEVSCSIFTHSDGSCHRQYKIEDDAGSKRYVMEHTKDGITSVTMFVLEGETFFSVQISGLTESPTVEYLQSFSAKVYED
ncbi:MAG: hypothetical protein IJ009_01995 [Clostridia bacterium]|nr:hypothetical protein [Clostridia bacterium]